MRDIPRQHNNHDCGVFICLYAEAIARGASLDFPTDTDSMRMFRRLIAYEIVAGRLLER